MAQTSSVSCMPIVPIFEKLDSTSGICTLTHYDENRRTARGSNGFLKTPERDPDE